MIFRQFLHTTPVAASYVVGCGGHGVCVVVDPLDPIDIYLSAAEAGRMRIAYVIDTHVHADHISAGRRLAETAGASYVLHESADAPGRSRFATVRSLSPATSRCRCGTRQGIHRNTFAWSFAIGRAGRSPGSC